MNATFFKSLAVTACSLVAFVHVSSAHAQAAAPVKPMVACSAEFKATGKPANERRAFMGPCMKAKSAENAQWRAQNKDKHQAMQAAKKQKRRDCRAQAKSQGLKGAAVRDFVKSCSAK